MSQKYILLIFKGICMNLSLELKCFILSHPVTSQQPHKIVQIITFIVIIFFFTHYWSRLEGQM